MTSPVAQCIGLDSDNALVAPLPGEYMVDGELLDIRGLSDGEVAYCKTCRKPFVSYPRSSVNGTNRYFRHFPQEAHPQPEFPTYGNGESDRHVAHKRLALETHNASNSWKATDEELAPDHSRRVDVLAIPLPTGRSKVVRGTNRVSTGIEIQLSGLKERDAAERVNDHARSGLCSQTVWLRADNTVWDDQLLWVHLDGDDRVSRICTRFSHEPDDREYSLVTDVDKFWQLRVTSKLVAYAGYGGIGLAGAYREFLDRHNGRPPSPVKTTRSGIVIHRPVHSPLDEVPVGPSPFDSATSVCDGCGGVALVRAYNVPCLLWRRCDGHHRHPAFFSMNN